MAVETPSGAQDKFSVTERQGVQPPRGASLDVPDDSGGLPTVNIRKSLTRKLPGTEFPPSGLSVSKIDLATRDTLLAAEEVLAQKIGRIPTPAELATSVNEKPGSRRNIRSDIAAAVLGPLFEETPLAIIPDGGLEERNGSEIDIDADNLGGEG